MVKKASVDVDIDGNVKSRQPVVTPTRSPTDKKGSSRSKTRKSSSSTSKRSSGSTTTKESGGSSASAKKRKRVIVVEDIDEDEDDMSAEQIEDIANLTEENVDDVIESISSSENKASESVDSSASKKESSKLFLDLIGTVLEELRDVDIDHSISFHTNVYTSYLLTVLKNVLYVPLIASMYNESGVLFKLQHKVSVHTTPLFDTLSNYSYMGTAKALTIIGISQTVDSAKHLIDDGIVELHHKQSIAYDWVRQDDNHTALYCIIACALFLIYYALLRDTIDSFTGLPVAKAKTETEGTRLDSSDAANSDNNNNNTADPVLQDISHPKHRSHYENADNDDDIDDRYQSRKMSAQASSGSSSSSSKEHRRKSLAFNTKEADNVKPTTSTRGSVVAQMRRAVGSMLPTSRIFGAMRSNSNSSAVTPVTTASDNDNDNLDQYFERDTNGSVKTHTISWNVDASMTDVEVLNPITNDTVSMRFGENNNENSNNRKKAKDTRFLPTVTRRTGRFFGNLARAFGVGSSPKGSSNKVEDMNMQSLNDTYAMDDLSEMDGSVLSGNSEEMRPGRSHSGLGTWRDSNNDEIRDFHEIKTGYDQMTEQEIDASTKFTDPEGLIGYRINIRTLGSAVVLATRKDLWRTSYFTVLMDTSREQMKAHRDEDVLVDIYLRRKKKLAKGYPFSEVAYVGIDSDERTALALHRLYQKEDKESTGERSSLILCSPEQVLKMRNFDERNIPETSSIKSGATDDNDQGSERVIENKTVGF